MAKQMFLFQEENYDKYTIWLSLPVENRQYIEKSFAKIIIKYFSASLNGIKKKEKFGHKQTDLKKTSY